MSDRSSLIDYDQILRLILVGDTNTGKTTILNSYINLRKGYIVNDPTIGIDFASRVIQLRDGRRVKLQCWDTAGQEKFRCIVRSYFRGICCCLLTFDVTSRRTFNNLDRWLSDIKDNNTCKNHDHPILLIGTKIDKPNRVVGREEAKIYASERDLFYIEINALTCETLDMAMIQLVSHVHTSVGTDHCPGLKRVSSIEIGPEVEEPRSPTKICCTVM